MSWFVTRLTAYRQPSHTLTIAEGQYLKPVVARIGFERDCISPVSDRPLHMASRVDAGTVRSLEPYDAHGDSR
jgi:hypothetical protein